MERFLKIAAVSVSILFALAACSKGNQSSSSSSASSAAASPVESAAATESGSPMAMGAATASSGGKVFTNNCASCHQANGQGIEGTFPPLALNPVVNGDPTKVIHIVKYGLTGSINVEGHSYNGMMPAWSQQLSNADIAAAITFVRSSWGNKGSPVTESQVSAVSQ
jgi:mono/diheme cytochrome c family protein